MRGKSPFRLLLLVSLFPSTLGGMVCYDIVSPMHPEILTPVDCWPTITSKPLTKRATNNGNSLHELQGGISIAEHIHLLNPRAGATSGHTRGPGSGPGSGPEHGPEHGPKHGPGPSPASSAAFSPAVRPASGAVSGPGPPPAPDSVPPRPRPPSSHPAPGPAPGRLNSPPAPFPPSAGKSSPPSPSSRKFLRPSAGSSSKLGAPIGSSSGNESDLDHDNSYESDHEHDDDDGSDHDDDDEPNLPFFNFAPNSPLRGILRAPALPAPDWTSDQQIFFNLDCEQSSTTCEGMAQTLNLAGWYVSQVLPLFLNY